MAHQHRLGNWKTEDNKLVRDARAMRNMLVESNSSSSSSFSIGFNNLMVSTISIVEDQKPLLI